MDACKEPIAVNVSPPAATFTRSHYEALQYMIGAIEDDAVRTSVVNHFNHYFRGTQSGYDSAKFVQGCATQAQKHKGQRASTA